MFSKEKVAKKAAEQEAIRKMYKTREYSMRALKDHFKRSLQYIYNAIHAGDKSVDSGDKKPLTK